MAVDVGRLRKLEERESAADGLSQAEKWELRDLRDSRQEEILGRIPVPPCCTEARRYPTIVFAVRYGEEIPSNQATGRWEAAVHPRAVSEKAKDAAWYENYPEPKFCPFCGTRVPKMVRKDPPPTNICLVQDGGYYCSTCKERLNDCVCDPLSSAFEPEHEEGA
jgi:hypothetical protein